MDGVWPLRVGHKILQVTLPIRSGWLTVVHNRDSNVEGRFSRWTLRMQVKTGDRLSLWKYREDKFATSSNGTPQISRFKANWMYGEATWIRPRLSVSAKAWTASTMNQILFLVSLFFLLFFKGFDIRVSFQFNTIFGTTNTVSHMTWLVSAKRGCPE